VSPWSPDTIKGFNKNNDPQYIISKKMLRGVWKRLRDRLASVDSSTSTIEITNDYAAHFYNMYINNHEGKHMTGDRMKILLLSLPFLLRDLVAPEVRFDLFPDIIPDNIPDIMSDIGANIGVYLCSLTDQDHQCCDCFC
jgi:hypothetical protein